MERQKILDELAEVRAKIEELKALLASDAKVTEVIIEELDEMREKYADARRTELAPPVEDFTTEDLIAEEDMVVTITHRGYAKRHVPALYRAQKRGGKGKVAAATTDEDFVSKVFVASTHAYLLCFTNKGRVHWLKVFELPELSRGAKGKALVNLLAARRGRAHPGDPAGARLRRGRLRRARHAPRHDQEDGARAVLEPAPRRDHRDQHRRRRRADRGRAHAAAASRSCSPRRTASRSASTRSRCAPMGRSATGVRGISTREGDATVGMEVLKPGKTILTVSENGFGKRSPLDEYREQNRGGQGIITIKTSERNGQVVGIMQVDDRDEIMLITSGGKMIRTRVAEIPTMSRNTQGVRLMEPSEGERVVSVAKLGEEDEVEASEAR